MMAVRPAIQRLTRDNLPSLAALIGEARADGFEDFVASCFGPDVKAQDEREQAFVRLLQIFGVAIVEASRRECELGRDPLETLQTMPRALGFMLFANYYGHADEGAPPLRIAKMLGEEIAFGIRQARLQMTAKAPSA